MSRGPIPDDFEYPTPQRETLWTLPDKKRTQMTRQSQPRDPNTVSDIAGASHGTTASYMAVKTFVNKPNLYDSKTVEGAAPRRLVPLDISQRNNPIVDKSLMTKDLGPSASPNAQQFQTARSTDPLAPQYPFPVKSVSPSMDPRSTRGLLSHPSTFNDSAKGHGGGSSIGYTDNNKSRLTKGEVRDVLKIDDIRGTRAADNRSNTVVRTHSPARDPINYNDVPFSTAGSKHQPAGGGKNPYVPSMSLVTSDICKNDIVGLQSSRHTNPLAPNYTVTGAGGVVTSIGEVKGSNPKPQPTLRQDRPMLSLRSDDIEGAQPLKRFGDALTSGPVRQSKRR